MVAISPQSEKTLEEGAEESNRRNDPVPDFNFAAPGKVISESSPIFPSIRLLVAILLCLCFIALSVSTSNLALSVVCMVKKLPVESSPSPHPRNSRSINASSESAAEAVALSSSSNSSCPWKHEDEDGVQIVPCSANNRLEWTSLEEGFIFAAQNVGSLMMLLTGPHSDRLNGKWTICASLTILVISNLLMPFVAPISLWLAFICRIMAGMSDAFLFPSASSMISRWFPPKERPFALGFVTGGRQIGTLLILPLAGMLCSSSSHSFGGWPAIFYLSAVIAATVLVIWTILSADKPSKHFFISIREEEYVGRKIAEESLGKRTERGSPPWRAILSSRPLFVAVAALVCHEYPLVIMLQLLPKYFSDVLHLDSTTNGIVSALPMIALWLSKTLSSSVASFLTAKQRLSKTASCKFFNLLASLGLGLCVGAVPFITHPAISVVLLCLANAFAGLHTPGVQTALIQLAPAYSGIVTGISFSFVAVVAIFNKILSFFLTEAGSSHGWTIVFEISAVVALLPVVFFTLWGSAERQSWASRERKRDEDEKSETLSEDTSVVALAKLSMYLSHQVCFH